MEKLDDRPVLHDLHMGRMPKQWVTLEKHGAVLEITLDKPKVNAICRQLSSQLYEAACVLRDDPALQVGVLSARGDRAFSAGWDFNEAIGSPTDEGLGPGGFGGITALWDLDKPLIAAVGAPAIGGGFELALACDMIVMAQEAFFQLPEMQRGILPDGGGVQRLPRRIPYNVAVGMMLTGRRMGAEEAKAWGLVHAALPAGEVAVAARELAATVAQGAPLALQALKEVMRGIEVMPLEEAMAIHRSDRPEFATYRRMAASEDAKEGPRAFLERRTAVWKGR